MKCSERAVLDFLEGILRPEEEGILTSHLAACTTCSKRLADFQKTLQLTSKIQPPSLTQLHANSVVPRVRSQLARRDVGSGTSAGWRRLWAPALSGAFGSAVVVVSLFWVFDWVPGESHLSTGIAEINTWPVGDSGSDGPAAIFVNQFDSGEDDMVSSTDLALQMEDYLMDTAAGSELFEVVDTFVFNDDDFYSLLETY